MDAEVFTVDFELTVDAPGLDVRELIHLDGYRSVVAAYAGGTTFAGSAPVRASKTADAESALRKKLQNGAADAGRRIVSFDVTGSRATAGSG